MRSSSMTLRSPCSSCAVWAIPRRMVQGLDEDRDGAALGLEDRLFDVAEVLTVDLERHRAVARHLEQVEIVAVEHWAHARPAGQDRERDGDDRAAAHAQRRDKVEP